MDSSGKGKGKAKAVDNASPDGLDGLSSNTSAGVGSTDNSAAFRIQQSAIELTRAILSAGPESFSMGADIADKPRDGASTNAGPSSLERGETSQARSAQTSVPGSSAARFSQTPGVGQQAAADYDLFLRDATALPSLLSPAEYGGRPDQATHVAAGQHGTAIQEQEARDGADVLNLLASPDILDLTEDPNIDPDLSPEDVDMLRKALFEGPSQRGTANWDSLLNLAPDFLLAGDPEATRQHLGVSDNAEGIKQWLDQWRDVLDQYTDEVWGDLGPLAQDARREVDQAEKQQEQQPIAGQQGNLKALGRLRQILAHVRGP